MKGFLKYTVHAIAGTVVFLLLGIVFFPFLLLAPLMLISIIFYPLFKLLMPELMRKRGY